MSQSSWGLLYAEIRDYRDAVEILKWLWSFVRDYKLEFSL